MEPTNIIRISTAAVYVSCQEITTTLSEGQQVCPGDKITFTCTAKGSPSLTSLILAWSSTEYIGPDDYLQFTTDTMPGTNVTSTINRNVIATLINNTRQGENGVPVLESQLQVIASEEISTSTVTCHSLTSGRAASKKFSLPG